MQCGRPVSPTTAATRKRFPASPGKNSSARWISRPAAWSGNFPKPARPIHGAACFRQRVAWFSSARQRCVRSRRRYQRQAALALSYQRAVESFTDDVPGGRRTVCRDRSRIEYSSLRAALTPSASFDRGSQRNHTDPPITYRKRPQCNRAATEGSGLRLTVALREPYRRFQTAGMLHARHEEVPDEIFVAALEAGQIGIQFQVRGRDSGGEQTPDGGVFQTNQIHFAGLLSIQKSQRRENVLHAVGVVAEIERQKINVRAITRRNRRAGLERIDQQHRPLGAQQCLNGC